MTTPRLLAPTIVSCVLLTSTSACFSDNCDTEPDAPGCAVASNSSESGEASSSGDGDGDGDPDPSGDGDGDPDPSGDGDGEPDPSGDGDGEPDPSGDGDGDPTTQPCADAEPAFGEQTFMRMDIVLCPNTDTSAMPGSEIEGDALCGPDWHLCSQAEVTARNNDCDPSTGNWVGLVAKGVAPPSLACAMSNVEAGPGVFDCNIDFVRQLVPGPCTGDQSDAVFGFQEAEFGLALTGEATHGALCCL